MKICIIFLFGITFYCDVLADCDWATNTPPDDKDYKYFVAKSYSDKSAQDAAVQAERDIDNQIGRLFGTLFKVQSEFYSDETTTVGTTRSYERTIGTISLKNLERQKSNVHKGSNGWVGCVQYRYSQKEYKKEKQRLDKLSQKGLSDIVFNESVGDTTCRGAPVEIITTPAKAFVTIDDGKYQGESPIKFGNVCNGKHSLEITKENYSDINEILVVPGNNEIKKTLQRQTKNIQIKTSLGNSNIIINNIEYGKEPIKFSAPLGIEHKITAKNPEAIDITRTISFSKYSDSEYIFNMEKIPGKIDFSAFKVRNPGVKISVNGKTITGNTTGELSADKKQDLVFSKSGFFDIEKSLRIKGGETTYYPSKELEFSKEPRIRYELLAAFGMNSHYNLLAMLELAVKYQISKNIGVRGVFGLQIEKLDIEPTIIDYDFYKYKFNPNCKTGKTCEKVTFNEWYAQDKNWYSSYYGYWEDLENPVISKQHQSVEWKYNEPIYIQFGLTGLKKLYVFTVGAIGFLEGHTTPNKYLPLTEDKFHKTIFRFGFGAQYNITKNIGLRLQYLTSGTKVSLPYDIHDKAANIGAHYTDSYSDPDYVWLYNGQIKNVNAKTEIEPLQSFSAVITLSF